MGERGQHNDVLGRAKWLCADVIIVSGDFIFSLGYRGGHDWEIFFVKFQNWVGGILCNSQNKNKVRKTIFLWVGCLIPIIDVKIGRDGTGRDKLT